MSEGGFLQPSDPSVRISKGGLWLIATLTSLGVVVAGAVFWVVSSISTVQTETRTMVQSSNAELAKQMAILTAEVAALKWQLSAIQDGTADRYTRTDARRNWRVLGELNPTIKVPVID